MNFLEKFDGSDRTPRALQVEALKWISTNWSGKVLALNLPTGVGKSAIARAIQIETGAAIVPPTNVLMDQYVSTYPGVNALKGRAHYECLVGALECGSTDECDNCPYVIAREKAETEPTFFNPHSLFYFDMHNDVKKRPVLVIDEAHKLRDFIMSMSGKSFNEKKYSIPKSLADVSISQWLENAEMSLLREARGLDKKGLHKKAADIYFEAKNVKYTRLSFEERPENYAVDIQRNSNGTKSLVVQPILPPRYIANRILKADKLILMSATLLPSDIEEILGHGDFKFLDLPSPIDKERRQIIYAPTPHPMTRDTHPKLVADAITKIVEKHPGENTIVHVTYALAKMIAPYIKFKYLANTPENKEEKIQEFKCKGGVFIASGCSEGVDLPGDFCRVNIIPLLFRLNPTDPVVKKKLGKPNGRTWYNYETIKALIQQAGRSTRGEDDFSRTYVLDSALARLMVDNTLKIPRSLKESIVWNANLKY
jgi:Rad3-related DNA helicase